MDPDGAAAANSAVHQALRDVFRTGRMLRQSYPSSVPAGLVGVLAAIDAIATPAGNRCHGKDLATRCGLDPSTVSRSVSSLVALDLVRRDADPVDGRASLLALTPRGRQCLDDAERWHSGVVAEVLADWTEAEVQQLVTLLRRFTADADRHARAAVLPLQRRSSDGQRPHSSHPALPTPALEAAQ